MKISRETSVETMGQSSCFWFFLEILEEIMWLEVKPPGSKFGVPSAPVDPAVDRGGLATSPIGFL